MSSKPQSTSKLDRLPKHQLEALERWLMEENISYAQARSRLFQDFGVRVGSDSSLSAFYQRCQQRRLLDRIAASAQTANAVVAKFDENPSDTYRALLGMVGKIAFDKALQEQLDAATIFDFTKLMIASRKEDVREQALGLEREKLELLKRKAEKAEAAETTLKDETLSPAERQQRLKQIFGI